MQASAECEERTPAGWAARAASPKRAAARASKGGRRSCARVSVRVVRARVRVRVRVRASKGGRRSCARVSVRVRVRASKGGRRSCARFG
jgi:hypothetical protein